jgi:hypothetical protein
MANLSANPSDLTNVTNKNTYNPCLTPKCSKINHDFDNKNHNHSTNNLKNDYCYANKFMVFHQNIQGIKNKIDEFLISLPHNVPQVICLTEHHLQMDKTGYVNFGQHTLGSAFCRQMYKQGCVCIYISKNIRFNAINLDQYIKEIDLEMCALKLCLLSRCFTVICLYRSPTGDFNVNYLNDNSRKHISDALLASFGLFSTVKFPNRISYQTCTLTHYFY